MEPLGTGAPGFPRQREPRGPVSWGMVKPSFVDVHSHMCPSGDDGAQSLQEGRAVCRSAAEHGTRLLFATPHI